uniref:Uncharacterized protein n=1 Tax=Panagrolaimus sp. JU765 TaxID=591449 RepID=A0AC34RGX8_9BILA
MLYSPCFFYFLAVVFLFQNVNYAQNLKKSSSNGNLKSFVNSSFPCRFPILGDFYIEEKSRHRILKIEDSHFESKGECLKADKRRDFFVLKHRSGSDACFRCILFLSFHTNVIRFKESPCVREETDLDHLCRKIAGDSPLFTLFRINAKPIPCPIPLPATFSYHLASSGDTCKNDGRSLIDECSVPNRFRLSFVSCPEASRSVTHDEAFECIADWNHYSTVPNRFRLSFVSCPEASRSVTHDEAFECIADWNHYSTYYFAARVVGNPFNPALGDYRCFIVDQQTSRIGISMDSSCLELTALDQA